MKKKLKLIPIILVLLTLGFAGHAGQRTTTGPGSWNNPNIWNPVGVPVLQDCVTIAHAITLNSSIKIAGITINAGGSLDNNGHLVRIYHLFNNKGTYSGSANTEFQGAGKQAEISGNGSFNDTGDWLFYANSLFTGTDTITKNSGYLDIKSGITVTNNAPVRLGSGSKIIGADATTSWVQGPNAFLGYSLWAWNPPINFDFSAIGNTVAIETAGNTRIQESSTYYNLSLEGGGGTKYLYSTFTPDINGILKIGSGVTMNFNGNNMNLAGNWINNGTITNNTGTNTFDGTTTLSGSSVFSLPAVVITGTLTSSSGTVNISKNFTNNGTFNHNSGTVTFTGTTQLLGSANSNFNNLNITGTLTGGPLGGTISVDGNWNNTGTFTHNNTRVAFSGTGNQSIDGSATTVFYRLNIANTGGGTVTMSSGTYQITDALTVTSGTFDPAGLLTLISNASSTARIASVGGTISGSMTVQRYISGRSADWSDMASPVNSAMDDWDNEIYMSAVNGPDGIACCPTFYSVWEYNEGSTGWDSITNAAGTTLSAGKGFELFLGDDLNNWNGGTMDTRGIPYFGDQVINVSNNGSDGWNLVGNPYASFLSWTAISADAAFSNLDDNFQIYDAASQSYIVYGDGDEIPPHQGFFVHSSSGTPTMTIKESHKTTTTTSTFRNLENNANKLTLMLSNDQNHILPRTEICFKSGAFEGSDPKDAHFLPRRMQKYFALYTLNTEQQPLSRNVLPTDGGDYSIPLKTKVSTSGDYKIMASGMASLDAYSTAWLEDTKTGVWTDLNINPEISVYLDKDASDSKARFVLHFSNTINGISAHSNGKSEWYCYVSGGIPYIQFNMDESTDVQIDVYDALGRMMRSSREQVMQNRISIAGDLAPGVYIVRVISHGVASSGKFEVTK